MADFLQLPRSILALRHGDGGHDDDGDDDAMAGMTMGSSSSTMSSMSGMHMGDDPDCTMHMLGNWQTIGTCILTSSWKISSNAQFAGSVIGVFLLVTLIELIRRWGREWDRYIVRKEMTARAEYLASLETSSQHETKSLVAHADQPSGATQPESEADITTGGVHGTQGNMADPSTVQKPKSAHRVFFGLPAHSPASQYWSRRAPRFRPTVLQQLVRSFIYALQFTGAYLIMLIAMTFNGYLILAIILGGLFGHFVSTWDALAFDLSNTDEDPYLLAIGGAGNPGGVHELARVAALSPNSARTEAAAKATDQSYHGSGACCG